MSWWKRQRRPDPRAAHEPFRCPCDRCAGERTVEREWEMVRLRQAHEAAEAVENARRAQFEQMVAMQRRQQAMGAGGQAVAPWVRDEQEMRRRYEEARTAQLRAQYQGLGGLLGGLLGAGGELSQVDAEAEKTAEALLLRHLTEDQKASWLKHKGFWVTAKSGTRYWLDGGRPRGIPDDGPPQSFCIYGIDEYGAQLPKCDQILAQKLLIETDEERFIKTANAARI